MSDMLLFSIMPLDTEHIDEVCEDIADQYKNGITTCPLFCMTLVPEGDPPADKAGALCEKYALFKSRLDSAGIPSGVLVQATIGHGWVLSKKFPFQQYTKLSDGKPIDVVCPYDEGFKEYIYNVFRKIASCYPDHIMVDDDFRLLARDGGGCVCPLHMKRINELAGTSLSEEALRERLSAGDTELNGYFIEAQRESLVETAKAMRSGIDSVDPSLPASFCTVGRNAEFAAEIAHVLKGEGNPSVVRINNGNYTAAGLRFSSDISFRAAVSAAKLKGRVEHILAETDTCPQNRYSTGAAFLHLHFTLSILEGLSGAKHWITRLSAFEPQSGTAYRRKLSKNGGFYRFLSDIAPKLSWKGCRIPLMGEPDYGICLEWNEGEDTNSHWAHSVLERLGLPMFFSADSGGVLCFEGDHDKKLSDEQLKEAFGGSMLISSDTAERLAARGFSKYIGVDIKPWEGLTPSYEKLFINNNVCTVQRQYKQIIPLNVSVKPHSMVYHAVEGIEPIELFPGVVEFENELGGRIFTFCGTPKAEYNLVEAFSFLNYSRKLQLISLLEKTGEMPVYYPNDEEIYLRLADMPGGQIFCGIFNIGFDAIEKTELICKDAVLKIEKLMPDGSLSSISFEQNGKAVVIDTPCTPAEPLILILSKQ